MVHRRIVLGCLWAAATVAWGHGVEVSLSTKTANLVGNVDLAETQYGYTRLNTRGFFNEQGDIVGSIGVAARGMPAGKAPTFAIVGIRGYAGHLDELDQDVMALSLGAGAGVTIPANMPVSISGRADYAPDITSFADASNLFEGDARLALEVMPGTSGFVGYRYLRVEMQGDNPELVEHRPHIGIRISF